MQWQTLIGATRRKIYFSKLSLCSKHQSRPFGFLSGSANNLTNDSTAKLVNVDCFIVIARRVTRRTTILIILSLDVAPENLMRCKYSSANSERF